MPDTRKAVGRVKSPSMSRAPPMISSPPPNHLWSKRVLVVPAGIEPGHAQSVVLPEQKKRKAATTRRAVDVARTGSEPSEAMGCSLGRGTASFATVS